MFLTDGMLERNAQDVDIAALIAADGDKHPREAVQHLDAGDPRRDRRAGSSDDATAMCFDWHGGPLSSSRTVRRFERG